MIGSRNFTDVELAKKTLEELHLKHGAFVLISGGAKGGDKIGAEIAAQKGWECIIHPADWKLYGRRAGLIRNQTIISQADAVVAFWDGTSRGTEHSLRLAEEQGKPVLIIRFK